MPTGSLKARKQAKPLTASLLKYTEQQAAGPVAKLAPGYMRFLLGDEIANILDIPAGEAGSKFTISSIRAFNALRNLRGYNENNYYPAYSRLKVQQV